MAPKKIHPNQLRLIPDDNSEAFEPGEQFEAVPDPSQPTGFTAASEIVASVVQKLSKPRDEEPIDDAEFEKRAQIIPAQAAREEITGRPGRDVRESDVAGTENFLQLMHGFLKEENKPISDTAEFLLDFRGFRTPEQRLVAIKQFRAELLSIVPTKEESVVPTTQEVEDFLNDPETEHPDRDYYRAMNLIRTPHNRRTVGT